MPYVKEEDRNQMMLCSWDSLVDKESIARLIDAFVESLDLSRYGIKEEPYEGRPPYNPKSMYKLYLYGNRKGIRSSRKLQEACRTNIEVKWMTGCVMPDFRTISDFRKDNISSLKKIFHEFNKRIASGGDIQWGYSSVDGSKFNAYNSKNNNFTKNKLDDRITWLDQHTDEYIRQLDEFDKQDDLGEEDKLTKEVIESKLRESQERLEKYRAYQKLMEDEGLTQLSLTDADARLMKSKNGFQVAYNPQTAIDSETHLIHNFHMTNQVTDHGLLYDAVKDIKDEVPDKIIEVTADKGYVDTKDMVECLENGVIPHVITDDGKDGYDIEIPYEESNDADPSSTDPADLKKCLHAGVIPDCYENVIPKMEIVEAKRKVVDDPGSEAPIKQKSIYGSSEEMRARAMKGYFVRDPERNLVYCPAGEILRQKSIKKGGAIRYCNKNACKHCGHRSDCVRGRSGWKELDFSKDCLEKPCKTWPGMEHAEAAQTPGVRSQEPQGKWHYEKTKVVQFFLKPDIIKMSNRMCLSEHPFGTIKRTTGSYFFLLKGLEKVEGEFALFCLGYNMQRALNILGFDKMMALMKGNPFYLLIKMYTLFSFQGTNHPGRHFGSDLVKNRPRQGLRTA